ncbi:MAG: DUF2939 domain-containing protein [Caulobacter sp.]
MNNALFRLVVLAAALFALAFMGAPFAAYRALNAATAAEDVQAVSELVDFHAVRKSLAQQLDPEMSGSAEPPTIWQDPIGALRRAWKDVAPSEPRAEAYLTLDGLSALVRGYRPGAAPPPEKPGGGVGGAIGAFVGGPWPGVAYFGFDRVRLAVRRPGEPATVTVLTFERRDLFTWKLVHVQLPESER